MQNKHYYNIPERSDRCSNNSNIYYLKLINNGVQKAENIQELFPIS
jgi:hypothetical protein